MVSTFPSDQEQRRAGGARIIASGDNPAANPPIINVAPTANTPINNDLAAAESAALAAVRARRAAAADAAETRRNTAQQIGAPAAVVNPPVGNDIAANPPAGDGNDAPAANPPADDDDFPSILVCPISREPPVDAVTFAVEDENGQLSPQVFERRDLFLHIATQGVGHRDYSRTDPRRADRYVRHPVAEGRVRRDQALALIRTVPRETQDRITERRRQLGLSLAENQITQDDHDLFNRTIVNVLE